MGVYLFSLLSAAFFLIPTVHATSSADIDREKWENDYLDYNPEIDRYEDYAKGRNRKLYRAIGGGAKKITCSFYPDGNKNIKYLNPGEQISVSYKDNLNQLHEQTMIVGEALADDFGCMGACGPSCPSRGLPNAFTLDCLKHDLCVFEFGADPVNKRSDHPMCGILFDNAVDDWCKVGHIFQDSKER